MEGSHFLHQTLCYCVAVANSFKVQAISTLLLEKVSLSTVPRCALQFAHRLCESLCKN